MTLQSVVLLLLSSAPPLLLKFPCLVLALTLWLPCFFTLPSLLSHSLLCLSPPFHDNAWGDKLQARTQINRQTRNTRHLSRLQALHAFLIKIGHMLPKHKSVIPCYMFTADKQMKLVDMADIQARHVRQHGHGGGHVKGNNKSVSLIFFLAGGFCLLARCF